MSSAPKDRLQPCLLDRIVGDTALGHMRGPSGLTAREMREALRRDLAWLLSAKGLGAAHQARRWTAEEFRVGADQDDVESRYPNLDEFPRVAASVLNFGGPVLAGRASSSIDAAQVEREVEAAIRAYEPRIDSRSLKVHVLLREDQMNRNALLLTIEGTMWAQPMPEHLYLRTEVDLESGNVAVQDTGGR